MWRKESFKKWGSHKIAQAIIVLEAVLIFSKGYTIMIKVQKVKKTFKK